MSEKRYSFELRAEIRVEGSSLDGPPMQAVVLEQHDLPYDGLVFMQDILLAEPAVKMAALGKELAEKKAQGKPDR